MHTWRLKFRSKLQDLPKGKATLKHVQFLPIRHYNTSQRTLHLRQTHIHRRTTHLLSATTDSGHILAVMASTTPQQSISITTIALASTGVLLSGALAYALYFDHRRRSDPEFRRTLKKQHKKISKQNEEASIAAEKSQKARIKQAVEDANEEGFPKDPEETEGYFMQEVARGEQMCTDGSEPVEAALCFYKALKVYPQPKELIGIYDKTVPKVSVVIRTIARIED